MNNIIKRVWNQNRLVNIEDLTGMVFQAEIGGHTFEISGIDDTGAAVELSGTVSGVFRRPDNADIALTGSASDGVVSVTLSEDCYAVPGRFGLTIFVTSNSQKVAVYACVGTVAVSSTGNVAGDTPASVEDLIDDINAAIAALNTAIGSIPADYSQFMAAIAPAYSSSALYAVGSYAWHNGSLYRCITAITTAETWTAAHWTAVVLGDDVSDLKSAIDYINNVLNIVPDINVTDTVNATTKTIVDNLDLSIGDIITFTINSAVAHSCYFYIKDSSDETVTSRTLSAGDTTTSVTLTDAVEGGYISAITYDNVTINVVVTRAVEPENAIDQLDARIDAQDAEIATVTGTKMADGCNLKNADTTETGAGAYYWTSGQPTKKTSGTYGTDYTYYILPVDKNSVYSLSVKPRWLILTAANGSKVADEDTVKGRMIETGNATKLYLTFYNTQLEGLAISKGYLANLVERQVLAIEPVKEDHHGNSMPMDTMYFSTGITETLYYNNILALPTDKVSIVTASNGQDAHDANGITITPVSAYSNNVGVRIEQFDSNLNMIYKPYYTGVAITALSLANCSALVIGDSTVNAGVMTQNMLDRFTAAEKTLTLIGTRGEGSNKHEGRGGWSAKAYCTEASHGDYTNPFLNNGVFDFNYYMTQNEFDAPDFVIIQLGINDVSGIDIDQFEATATAALGYEKQIIDSILSYNSSIKILIAPPVTPNSDQSKLSMYYETTVYRNLVIRYAMMLRRLATAYDTAKVRCTNSNLILDSSTDINDNVHPTNGGYEKLGGEMVNQINNWL